MNNLEIITDRCDCANILIKKAKFKKGINDVLTYEFSTDYVVYIFEFKMYDTHFYSEFDIVDLLGNDLLLDLKFRMIDKDNYTQIGEVIHYQWK